MWSLKSATVVFESLPLQQGIVVRGGCMVTVRLSVLDAAMVFDRGIARRGHASGVQGICGGGYVPH